MLTRSAAKMIVGGAAKSVIEQPLIADKIITILLQKNDWVSVVQLLHVFRVRDCVGNKLSICKVVNDTNKRIYERIMFDTRISYYVQWVRNVSSFKRRIRIHDEMFEYIGKHYHLFETSFIYDSVFEMLFHYLQHEPFYERQALHYIKLLYPDIFYSSNMIEIYDDHEMDLFDDDYGPHVDP